jgi:hypothetical protein
MADKYMLDRPESKVGVCKSIRDDIQNVLDVIAEAKQDKAMKEREHKQGQGSKESVYIAEKRIQKYSKQFEDLKAECLLERCILIGNKCVEPTTHATHTLNLKSQYQTTPSKKGVATKVPFYIKDGKIYESDEYFNLKFHRKAGE